MNSRLQRQVSVYATLLGLTIVWRMLVPHMSRDVIGGLLFLVVVGGIGVNWLYDRGYKTWAVVVISASVVASNTGFYGLLIKGSLVALFVLILSVLAGWSGIRWGNPKTPSQFP